MVQHDCLLVVSTTLGDRQVGSHRKVIQQTCKTTLITYSIIWCTVSYGADITRIETEKRHWILIITTYPENFYNPNGSRGPSVYLVPGD